MSGSRPEGLAMDDGWGNDGADFDYMELYGGRLGVNVAGGQQPQESRESCLDFRPEGCPIAYTKLQVTTVRGLKKHWTEDMIKRCVHRSGDKDWLNTYQAIREMNKYNETITGPSAENKHGTADSVTTLVCNEPHPDIHQEFATRPRQWPPASLISVLLKLPMLLVLVGHKLSTEFHLQARTSWSTLELKLMRELPESVRQGYIACKYVLKRSLKARRGPNDAGDGRSRIGSYHIKTVFLRYLEKTPPSLITSPFGLFLDLLNELDECLKVGKLPQYFLFECNLLETMVADERDMARQVIKEILTDPLNALLTSPINPQQIYGEVHPDYLVSAFSRVSSHPMCEDTWKKLSELLACVDERRRLRYAEQRERDEGNYKVSGRVKLIGLADTLKEIKQH